MERQDFSHLNTMTNKIQNLRLEEPRVMEIQELPQEKSWEEIVQDLENQDPEELENLLGEMGDQLEILLNQVDELEREELDRKSKEPKVIIWFAKLIKLVNACQAELTNMGIGPRT